MRKVQPAVHIGFEDDDFLIAWKPHGVLTSGNDGNTFLRKVRMLFPSDVRNEIAACHRLDFPTCGWVIFGKHRVAARAMGALFAARNVQKSYLALVHGFTPPSIQVRWSLKGKDAVTACHTIAHGEIAGAGEVSLVQLHPQTGRTHQLRRHLHGAGHGIVGDDLYRQSEEPYRGKGLFLCAHGLDFQHPLQSGVLIDVKAPPSKKFTKIPFVYRSKFVERLHLSSHA